MKYFIFMAAASFAILKLSKDWKLPVVVHVLTSWHWSTYFISECFLSFLKSRCWVSRHEMCIEIFRHTKTLKTTISDFSTKLACTWMLDPRNVGTLISSERFLNYPTFSFDSSFCFGVFCLRCFPFFSVLVYY